MFGKYLVACQINRYLNPERDSLKQNVRRHLLRKFIDD